MAKYAYPAVFTPESGGLYSVVFPDVEGCYTCGDDIEDAIRMAEDVLAFTLYDYERAGKELPRPSALDKVSHADGDFVNFVRCDTLEYQRRNSSRAVKKTLSIPEWLNDAAERAGLNFSQVLQDALKGKLGVA